MKLYTVVVHNLQMCMKEFRCCLKFRRGDNSTYIFTKRGVVYLVSSTPPKRLIGVLWNFTHLNCVKFHKNSISSLVGVALTMYLPPPPFRESISWIISPFKFWRGTIFLHAHLQVVYYKCVKFHKNPISRLGGVVLTRYMPPRLFVKV
jgi:hypothetical protein